MMVRQACVLADSVYLEITVLVGNAIDVHGPVAALSCDIFVEWIPGNTLHEVVVFRQLMKALAWG
jgi:hypothetical protein